MTKFQTLSAVAALSLAVLLSGCASSNKTGFTFPSFGLIGNAKQPDEAQEYNPNAGHSNRLIDSSTR